MKEKILFRFIVIISATGLMIVALFNYIVDPFYYYHLPLWGFQYLSYGEMNQNLNLAKNSSYNTIITGTSMSQNFRVSWFDEQDTVNAIKLTFAGGQTKDFAQLFEAAFASENDIETVYFGVDIYTLISPPDSTRFTYEKYQINANPVYDVQYLLNKDITLNYSAVALGHSLKHYREQAVLDDDLYMFDVEGAEFGKEILFSTYERPDIVDNRLDTGYGEVVNENLVQIGNFISDNPNTEFYLFYPPYSVLYWDTMIRNGEIHSQFLALKEATDFFLQFPNVHLYGYITAKDIVTNLDNYKDYTHYSSAINHWMFEEFTRETYLLTSDNYLTVLNEFEQYVLSFDYDRILSE